MKILMISNMYPSSNDVYFGSFIKNIKEGFESNDVSVDIICIKGQGIGIFDKIRKYCSFYIEILKTKLSNYDAVHISYPSHTYLPFMFKRFKNAKKIIRLHGLEIVSDHDSDAFLPLRKLITKISTLRSGIVVVPSKYFLAEAKKVCGSQNYYVYPSGGIDLNRFNILKPYSERVKGSSLRIGYVGRIDKRKGVDTLIDAVKHLSFDYSLHIIGKGPLLKLYKDKAENLNVNVKFYGPIDNQELINYYNDFDVFVFPTERAGESFGNVSIESMACGLPLVGSNFAGVTEYLKDECNGYFFEKGNSLDLASKLAVFHSLTDERKIQLSANAYDTACSYEKKYISNKFVEYIRRYCEK